MMVREWEGLVCIETRYEGTIADLERKGRRVTAFLGLSSDDAPAAEVVSTRRVFIWAKVPPRKIECAIASQRLLISPKSELRTAGPGRSLRA